MIVPGATAFARNSAGGMPTAGFQFVCVAKCPDSVRFNPIRAELSPIFREFQPNSHASKPIASDLTAKPNDSRFFCLTYMHFAAIARNRA